MEGVDWLNFRAHGFYSMRYLRNIRLRPELLRAAVSFWDPEVHVFRFGDQELCPTVEEFRAYLGGFGSGEVIIPPVRESAYRVLVAALGLSDNAARYLVRNGHLNAMRLIELFSPPGDLRDMTYQTRRMIALCMCLLAAYLLVPSAGHASSALASVVVQVEARKDVIPMVLAETLIGLDKFCSGETETFGGSPLLLQIWLCDKVNVLTIPPSNWAYEARLLSQRCFEFEDRSRAEWVDFLRRRRAETIASFTFYIPYRIQRQLGLRQEGPAEVLVDVVLPFFGHSVLCHYQRFWRTREMTDAHPYPSVAMRGSYRKWLRMDIAARAGVQGN
ncbi:hypothetical protein RHMOL_Rhmol02G0184000 [Rhododendron molle]|uniref:Uncharacterized protein n=1 Tax=Rhododendron molle TaxID=49168 RepID=A0ACC0PSX9_RHOML|nr:hypothetical protein RHMOL_Rhmol02G0184000 [Rhododendron molle]